MPRALRHEYERARPAAALARLTAAQRRRDVPAQHAAAAELAELHLDVARSIAGRYRRRGIAADDLEQVACLGLIRAAHRYQPALGADFLAYAVPVIHGDLRHHFRDHGWVVRPPRRVQELQGRVVRELDRVGGGHEERQPGWLAERLGTTVAEVHEALAAEGCFTPLSLDRPIAGNVSTSVGDSLPDPREDDPAEARAMLRSAVRGLSARDRQILGMRYFEQLTQQEMAQRLGVTQTQVSKLIARILRDLRAVLGEVDGPTRGEGGRDRRDDLQRSA